eukprot:1936827-Pyramimonas_sp.AAC.2
MRRICTMLNTLGGAPRADSEWCPLLTYQVADVLPDGGGGGGARGAHGALAAPYGQEPGGGANGRARADAGAGAGAGAGGGPPQRAGGGVREGRRQQGQQGVEMDAESVSLPRPARRAGCFKVVFWGFRFSF